MHDRPPREPRGGDGDGDGGDEDTHGHDEAMSTPFTAAPSWSVDPSVGQNVVWRFLSAMVFPRGTLVLFFDLIRGFRVMDDARAAFTKAEPLLLAVFMAVLYTLAALLPVFYYRSDTRGEISITMEVWGPIGLTALTLVLLATWAVVGRDGTEVYVGRDAGSGEYYMACARSSDRSERRWRAMHAYTFAVEPFDPKTGGTGDSRASALARNAIRHPAAVPPDADRGDSSRSLSSRRTRRDSKIQTNMDDQYRAMAQSGSFNAAIVAAYVLLSSALSVRRSRLWRLSKNLAAVVAAAVQGALPTASRWRDDTLSDLDRDAQVAAVLAGVLLFILVLFHSLLLLHAIEVYRGRLLQMQAMAAMLFEHRHAPFPKLTRLPDLKLDRARHAIVWSKMRVFLIQAKYKRFLRFQIHGTLLLLPFLLAVIYGVLRVLTDSTAGFGLDSDLAVAVLATGRLWLHLRAAHLLRVRDRSDRYDPRNVRVGQDRHQRQQLGRLQDRGGGRARLRQQAR